MASGGVIPHWRGRRALQLHHCTHAVREFLPSDEGDDSDTRLASRRDCVPNASLQQGRLLEQRHCLETPRSRGVGTPLSGRPADIPPSWVSGLLPPGKGGTSKRAATLEPTKRRRGRLGPRAGNPKRTRPNCNAKRYSRTSAGSISAQKGRGPKDPGVAAPLATAGCRGSRWCDTGGRSRASAFSSPSTPWSPWG